MFPLLFNIIFMITNSIKTIHFCILNLETVSNRYIKYNSRKFK